MNVYGYNLINYSSTSFTEWAFDKKSVFTYITKVRTFHLFVCFVVFVDLLLHNKKKLTFILGF